MKSIIHQRALILSIFVCSSVMGAYAQNLVINQSGAQIDAAISAGLRSEVLSSATQTLNQYADFCSLAEPSGIITDASILRFYPLFEPAARLCRDFAEPAEASLVDLNAYVLEVQQQFAQTGIRSTVSNPVLVNLQLDRLDRDVVLTEIRVTRAYENYLRSDGNVGNYAKPVTRDLILTFAASVYYTEESFIRSVKFASIPDPQISEEVIPQVEDPREGAEERTQEAVESTKLSPTTSYSDLLKANTVTNGIDNDALFRVAEKVASAIDLYSRHATLIDPATGTVTATSISHFEKLFVARSRMHVADFEEYASENLEISDYASRVSNLLSGHGVEFTLLNPEISSISYDPEGFYRVNVLAIKRITAYIDEVSRDRKLHKKPSDLPVAMSYEVGDIDDFIHLTQVSTRDAIAAPEETKTLLGLVAGFGSLSLNTTAKENWSEVTGNTTLSASSKLGIGLEFKTNAFASKRAITKPLLISAGVSYNRFNITSESVGLMQSSSLTTIDLISGVYDIDIARLDDKIAVDLIEIPVGIDYRVLKLDKARMQVYICGRIMPTYVLSATHTYTASPVYNLTYHDYGFAFFDENGNFQLNPDDQPTIENAYHIGDHDRSSDGNPIESEFLLGYEVGAQVHLVLSRDFLFLAGLKYQGYTGAFVPENEDQPDFPFVDRPLESEVYPRNSILQDFYTGITANAIGASLGIALRL